jgi:hypothetical protein
MKALENIVADAPEAQASRRGFLRAVGTALVCATTPDYAQAGEAAPAPRGRQGYVSTGEQSAKHPTIDNQVVYTPSGYNKDDVKTKGRIEYFIGKSLYEKSRNDPTTAKERKKDNVKLAKDGYYITVTEGTPAYRELEKIEVKVGYKNRSNKVRGKPPIERSIVQGKGLGGFVISLIPSRLGRKDFNGMPKALQEYVNLENKRDVYQAPSRPQ